MIVKETEINGGQNVNEIEMAKKRIGCSKNRKSVKRISVEIA